MRQALSLQSSNITRIKKLFSLLFNELNLWL